MIQSFYYTVFFLTAVVSTFFSYGQNVGINTTSPQASLDVRGSTRAGGINNFMSHDSVTGKINWINSYLFVPSNQQLIQHSDFTEGLYYNNSALEYRNRSGAPVFLTNWNTALGYFSGNVGIGTTNPAGKLHIQAGISGVSGVGGNLISETNGNNYIRFYTPGNYQSAVLFQKPAHLQSGGIYYNSPGLPNGLLFRNNNAPRMNIDSNGNIGFGGLPLARLHIIDGAIGNSNYLGNIILEGAGAEYVNIITPSFSESGILIGDASDIASGGIVYNNTATPNGMQFRTNGNVTRMVLTGNGYLGVGNLNPSYLLDVSGRMRIRSNGGFNTAGLYLNNNANNASPAFIGMDDDTHAGFWGSGVGWKFSMNTTNGALKVNGSEGSAGQVITSNGSSQPQWMSPTNSLFNNTVIKVQNANITINGAGTSSGIIPNSTHTFTVNSNAKVMVSFTLHTYVTNTYSSYPEIYVNMQLDNTNINCFFEAMAPPGTDRMIKGAYLVSVSPGTHTLQLLVDCIGADVIIYGSGSFPGHTIYKTIQE